ncbi:hypothetical protein BJX64DRAFT_271481 [Aspergillus heterothallicus]
MSHAWLLRRRALSPATSSPPSLGVLACALGAYCTNLAACIVCPPRKPCQDGSASRCETSHPTSPVGCDSQA